MAVGHSVALAPAPGSPLDVTLDFGRLPYVIIMQTGVQLSFRSLLLRGANVIVQLGKCQASNESDMQRKSLWVSTGTRLLYPFWAAPQLGCAIDSH